jgi:hypothetical protein
LSINSVHIKQLGSRGYNSVSNSNIVGCGHLAALRFALNRHPVCLVYQPPASSTFLSKTNQSQQPTNRTFLSEQISTSHQPAAKQTGCEFPS